MATKKSLGLTGSPESTKHMTGLRRVALLALVGLAAALLTGNTAWATAYVQTNLVSDIPGLAANTDANLVNPWGIASSPTSPFWVSDNKTGLTTLYNSAGVPQSLVVTIPSPLGGSTPTGQVFNPTADFKVGVNKALFIFATEDGTISGWAGGTAAIQAADLSGQGAVFKGLALGNVGSNNFLYATDFRNGTIDVFNASFTPMSLSGNFVDPNLPAGYAPFNIQDLNGQLYVTYAQQDATKHDDVGGPGKGFVDVFNTSGVLESRLISNGALNAPWGLALAPAGFGDFGGDLLVGNFGDGVINAFDPTTGTFLGTLSDKNGNPIVNLGLWGLKFGNDGNGGDANALYFTAGIPGPDQIEDHGLLGRISVSSSSVPEPTTLVLLGIGLVGLGFSRRVRAR